MSVSIVNAIWRARQNATLRAGDRAPDSAGTRRGYDPNQPRVPAGHPDGGQWTGAAYGPAHTEDVVVNEDGSTVRSEVNTSNPSASWEERHTVRMPDGEEFTFEDFGFTQTVYDNDGRPIWQTVLTDDGPEPQAIVEQVRGFRRPGGPKDGVIARAVEAALAWFAARSASNDRHGTAALSYRAHDYRTEADPEPKPVWVGQLTEREVRNTCERYERTQQLLEYAIGKVKRENAYLNNADFGNKVHKEVECAIKEENIANWLAEPSLQKLKEEDPRMAEEARLKKDNPRREPPEQPPPGSRGSIRVDVLDNQGNGTVCVYDIKTGEQHRLTPARVAEIARGVYYHFPRTRGIIVVEMRPMTR